MDFAISWNAAGSSMDQAEDYRFLDTHDGDTPHIRMPIRLLSVDTPEITANNEAGAKRIDAAFRDLAKWMSSGLTGVSDGLRDYLVPRLATGRAGSLQFQQGQAASFFAAEAYRRRLARPDGSQRKLFVRLAEEPFDANMRLLAYVAPNLTKDEIKELPFDAPERATFNLNLVEAGHAEAFVLFPSIPSARNLRLLIEASEAAEAAGIGVWEKADEKLAAYEYRMLERLYRETLAKNQGQEPKPEDRNPTRRRYCVDVTTGVLHDPEDYLRVPSARRLFIPADRLAEAKAKLGLD
jgi:endonuclease YncB( thermonuclease family)